MSHAILSGFNCGISAYKFFIFVLWKGPWCMTLVTYKSLWQLVRSLVKMRAFPQGLMHKKCCRIDPMELRRGIAWLQVRRNLSKEWQSRNQDEVHVKRETRTRARRRARGSTSFMFVAPPMSIGSSVFCFVVMELLLLIVEHLFVLEYIFQFALK